MAVWDIFGMARRAHGRGSSARAFAAAAALALLVPTAAAGQTSERLRFEAWGGALWDAYRNDGGNGRPAWLGAARLGYELGSGPTATRRWRLIGEVARAEAAEAGSATVADSLNVVFRTEWWLTTAGVEWDAITGWSGATLEARGGAAWIEREIVAGDSVPAGTPGTTARPESEPVPAAAIGISAWRYINHRLQVRIRLVDVITDPFDRIEHSPALGLGLRLVFD